MDTKGINDYPQVLAIVALFGHCPPGSSVPALTTGEVGYSQLDTAIVSIRFV